MPAEYRDFKFPFHVQTQTQRQRRWWTAETFATPSRAIRHAKSAQPPVYAVRVLDIRTDSVLFEYHWMEARRAS